MTCRTILQTLNSGSSRRPVTGMSRLIFPSASRRSVTASPTGSLVAWGLSTRSPSVSWSMTTLFSASSFMSEIRYLRSKERDPFSILYPA